MPTYEYSCKSCGKHLEVVQGFHDQALTTCPTCEGPLRKVFGNIAISFKGTGFYSTDNRSVAKSGAGTGVGTSESSGSNSGSADKGDSGGSGSSDSGGSGESGSSSSSESSSGSSGSDGGNKSEIKKSDGNSRGDNKRESKSESKAAAS